MVFQEIKEVTIEALWTVQFELANHGWTNGGVVVLESGRLFGGDSQYYYVGHYGLDGRVISGSMRSTHYHGPISTAFGTNEHHFELSIQAEWDGQRRINGLVVRPDLRAGLRFRMVKQADLP
jgi:hypothetical protein